MPSFGFGFGFRVLIGSIIATTRSTSGKGREIISVVFIEGKHCNLCASALASASGFILFEFQAASA
jgi:hypothetical protein